MRIGTVLRKWRRAEDRDMRSVADEIGLSLATLQRLETGQDCDAKTLRTVLYWLLADENKGERHRG